MRSGPLKTGGHVARTTPQQPANHEPFTALDQIKEDYIWTGASLVPEIGATVHVLMNDLGPGTVEAYILDEGQVGQARYLGLRVRLTDAPSHFLEQLVMQGRTEPVATVFGLELKVPALARPPLRLAISAQHQALTLIVHHDGRTELDGAHQLYSQERVVGEEILEGLRQFQAFLMALEQEQELQVHELEDAQAYSVFVGEQRFTWPRSTLLAYVVVGRSPAMVWQDPEEGDLRLRGPATAALEQLRREVTHIELATLGAAMLWPHAPVMQVLSPQTRERVAAVLPGLRPANEVLADLLPPKTAVAWED